MKAGDLVRWVALGGASAFGIVIDPPKSNDWRAVVLTSDGQCERRVTLQMKIIRNV